ncbi:MAG: protein kinase [Myxococcales bacterium]|nr:protein kinase [Myxococcales bacterium]
MSDPHRIGKYDVVARLAQGGMGNVYLARTQGVAGFEKLVVVKTLRADFADDPKFCEMFLDEARLAAKLNHRNIVQTNDAGVDGGTYYMVMDFLDGRSLWRIQRHFAKEGAHLPLSTSVRIIADMLAGLHHAHELTDAEGKNVGVVHRDVCPANVFVTVDGQVKVVDFGVAKAKTHAHETQAGTIKGRVAYMSPEHVQAGPIDRRADVFSAGILLWEAITRNRFWEGLNETQILGRLVRGQLPTLDHEGADPKLQAACVRALSPSPDDRFPTAHAMRLALEEWLERNEPRNGLADLGATLLELTAEERAKIARLLEAAPDADRTAPLPALDPTRIAGTSDSGASAPRGTSERSATAPLTPLATTTPIASLPPPSAPSRPLPRVLAGAVLVALVAAAATFFATRPRAPIEPPRANASEAPPPPKGPVVEVAPPTATPTDTNVTLDVAISPLSAKVYLDDRPLGANPFHGQLARDGRSHVLRAEAAGYKPRAFTFVLDRDRAVDFALEAYPQGGHAPPPTATPSPSPEGPSAAANADPKGIRELPVKPTDAPKPALDTDVFKK